MSRPNIFFAIPTHVVESSELRNAVERLLRVATKRGAYVSIVLDEKLIEGSFNHVTVTNQRELELTDDQQRIVQRISNIASTGVTGADREAI